MNLDALDVARRDLWRAQACDRLGPARDNFLQQASAALAALGEHALAARIAAAARAGGDGRDLDAALAALNQLIAAASLVRVVA